MDLTTGAITEIGEYSTAFQTNRLAVDANGTLWSLDNNGILWSVPNAGSLPTYAVTGDAPTLSTTQVVSHGTPTVKDANVSTISFSTLNSGDIAFDGTGTLWVLASAGGTATTTHLISVGPEDLAKTSGVLGTYAGAMGVPATVGGAGTYFNGLAFDEKGTLYASSVNIDTNTSSLYTVDPLTGKPTLLKSTTTSGGFGDLASCVLPMPRLQAIKEASVDSALAGDQIEFTITIKNTGTLPASGVTFQDAVRTGLEYVPNSSTLNGNPVAGDGATSPWLTAKPVNSPDTTNPGVISAGGQAVVKFKVTMLPMLPGQTKVCNQAQVDFVALPGFMLSDDPSQAGAEDESCVALAEPGIDLIKKINTDDANSAPGVLVPSDVPMNITFDVKNTGITNLKNVTVTDDRVEAGSIKCGTGDTASNVIPLLEPGQTAVCTGTLAPPAAGQQHTNTATSSGVPVLAGGKEGSPVNDTDPANAYVSGFSVKKETSQGPVALPAGQTTVTRDYTVTVTNNGLVAGKSAEVLDVPSAPAGFTITEVKVDGQVVTANAAGQIVCDGSTNNVIPKLAVGQTVQCHAKLVAPEAGVGHANVGTVVGTVPPTTVPGTTNESTTVPSTTPPTTPPVPTDPDNPSVLIKKLIKDVNGAFQDANDGPVEVDASKPVEFKFEVINNGNVVLSDVTVTDNMVSDSDIDCGGGSNIIASLQPGEAFKVTCTATMDIDEAFPVGGAPHVNVATVVGTPPSSTVPPTTLPGTTLPPTTVPGSTVPETTVPGTTNSTTTILGTTIPGTTLPGSTVPGSTVPGTTVPGTTNPGVPVSTTDPATATTKATTTPPVPGVPSIDIEKYINDEDAGVAPGVEVAVGSMMRIKFTVTNTGTTKLTGVKVTDEKVSNVVCPTDVLAPGESMDCTAELKAPETSDTQHRNVGSVSGQPVDENDKPVGDKVTDKDPGNAKTPKDSTTPPVETTPETTPPTTPPTAPGTTPPSTSTLTISVVPGNPGSPDSPVNPHGGSQKPAPAQQNPVKSLGGKLASTGVQGVITMVGIGVLLLILGMLVLALRRRQND